MLAKGDVRGAIADASTAIENAPQSARAHATRGEARGRSGDLDGAIADLSLAIEFDPGSAYAYYNRAYAKERKGDVDGAVDDYTHCIDLDPTAIRAFINRGAILGRRHDFDAAIADFGHAIELDPTSALAYDNRGSARWAGKDYIGATTDFARAARLAPSFASARQHRDQVFSFMKASIAELSRQIRESPKQADLFAARGDAYAASELYRLAIVDYEQAIRLNPGEALAHNNLAWLLATADDPAVRDSTRSVTVALEACELSKWSDADFLTTLAAAYARSGEFSKAVEWQQKAMAHSPLANSADERVRLRFYGERKAWPPN